MEYKEEYENFKLKNYYLYFTYRALIKTVERYDIGVFHYSS